jgi:hypothetical protein
MTTTYADLASSYIPPAQRERRDVLLALLRRHDDAEQGVAVHDLWMAMLTSERGYTFEQCSRDLAQLERVGLAGRASRGKRPRWKACDGPPMEDERDAPVDPFVFVAAVRYAIDRTLTSASETIATQVYVHAAAIARHPGARGAILNDIDEWLERAEPESLHGTGEFEALRRRWEETRRELASCG